VGPTNGPKELRVTLGSRSPSLGAFEGDDVGIFPHVAEGVTIRNGPVVGISRSAITIAVLLKDEELALTVTLLRIYCRV